MGKTVLEATVIDIQKRRYPSKHYVYVIEVAWSEGTKTVIYRRYSHFFEFQCGLLERFPIHAGAKNPADRCIPFLPGKKIFGRSHIRSVAEKRMGPISEYCKTVIRLPQEISEDPYILNFFEVNQEDINPPIKKNKAKKNDSVNEISDPILLDQYTAIADYKKQKNMECSLTAGQVVEVIDKNENGWWFVHMDDLNEGWVPATYLEPIYGQNEATKPIILEAGEEEIHITTSSYTAKHNDELSFERGVLMEVFQKGMDGWWKARYLNKEGYVPACYLNRYYGTMTTGFSGATQIVSTAKEAVNASSQQNITKGLLSKPTSIKTGVDPYADEPIYAPTPRKELIQKSNVRPPVAIPKLKSKVSEKNSFEDYETPDIHSQTKVDDNEDSEEDVFHDYETLSEHYVTVAEFQANVHDGLSFSSGVEVSVITKNPSGWWYVEMEQEEGWVPSSYLEKMFRPHDDSRSPVHSTNVSTKDACTSNKVPIKHESKPIIKELKTGSILTSVTKNPKTVTLKSPNLRSEEKKGNTPTTAPKPAQKPSVAIKPVKDKKALPVAAKTAPVSKGLTIQNEKPVVTISQPSSKGNYKPAVPHRAKVPTKSPDTDTSKISRNSLRRSSSHDSLLQLKEVDEPLRKAKSPPPIRPRPAEFIPPPKPKKLSPSSSSTMGIRYLRKSTENLVDNQMEANVPIPSTRSVHQRPSPQIIPRSTTLSIPKQTSKEKLHSEKVPVHTKPLPSRINQPSSTQTIKLGELEHALKTKKPIAASKRINTISNQQTKKVPPPRPSKGPTLSKRSSYVTIADFIGNDEGSLSFKEGVTVDVLEKSDEGWWYVSIKGNEGWVPSTFVDKTSNKPDRPKPPPPFRKTKPSLAQSVNTLSGYRAISDYNTPVYEDSGIDLVAGEVYEVLEKSSSGWWFVKHGSKEGWAPSSFLETL